MKLLILFQISFFSLKRVLTIYIKRKESWAFFLLLTLFLTLPVYFPTYKAMTVLEDNGQSIIASLPDFTIENQKLKTDNHSPFINQTDLITYAYDPNDTLSEDTLRKQNPQGLILMTQSSRVLVSFLGHTRTLPYSTYENKLSSQEQKDLIYSFSHLSRWVYVLAFFAIFTFFGLQIALIAVLISWISSQTTFSKNSHLTFEARFVYALLAIGPVVLFTALATGAGYPIPFYFSFIFLVGLIRLLLFFERFKNVTITPEFTKHFKRFLKISDDLDIDAMNFLDKLKKYQINHKEDFDKKEDFIKKGESMIDKILDSDDNDNIKESDPSDKDSSKEKKEPKDF